MAKLPDPPNPLSIAPAVTIRAAGSRLWRVYFAGGARPTRWSELRFFGPTNSRFDHHEPPPRSQSRGILYAADSPVTCLAEVFQATRVIDRVAREPWLVAFELTRDVSLLDLTGTWPARAGASMAIDSGPRPRDRLWSRAIHASYRVDGLLYCSSMHANEPAIALCERSEDAMPSAPVFHRALADAALRSRFDHAATALGCGLV